MMKKDVSTSLYQKCLILCSKILKDDIFLAPQYERNSFVTMATYWVPNLPDIKGFFGHLWHSILIFGNSVSSAWPIKLMNELGQVRGLVKCFFSSLKLLKYWNKIEGDWERVSCHGNRNCNSRRCVACRTISLPSFNGLCCKLTKLALFIYLM